MAKLVLPELQELDLQREQLAQLQAAKVSEELEESTRAPSELDTQREHFEVE